MTLKPPTLWLWDEAQGSNGNATESLCRLVSLLTSCQLLGEALDLLFVLGPYPNLGKPDKAFCFGLVS